MNDQPCLQPDVAVDEALRSVARAVLADARAAIEDLKRPAAEAVHDFRAPHEAVARAYSPACTNSRRRDGRALRDEARDLARALGGARDAQSALDALSDLAGHGDLSQRSLATLRSRIDELRRSAEINTLNRRHARAPDAGADKATASVELWPLQSVTFSDLARAPGQRLSRRPQRAARKIFRCQWSRAARAAQAHRRTPSPDGDRGPALAALRQDVDRRGATAA